MEFTTEAFPGRSKYDDASAREWFGDVHDVASA
jgi:hypothetical protein